MKVGTKSLLLGAHQFILHPIALFIAWWRLFGFPWDPRLWVAFVVHDWGYWGKSSMDGEDGKLHPELGGWIMHNLFDSGEFGLRCPTAFRSPSGRCEPTAWRWDCNYWGRFTKLHSRSYAKLTGFHESRLCHADKLAAVLWPAWLYVTLTRLTGEIHEYMQNAKQRVADHPEWDQETKRKFTSDDPYEWYSGIRAWLRRYVREQLEDITPSAAEVEDAKFYGKPFPMETAVIGVAGWTPQKDSGTSGPPVPKEGESLEEFVKRYRAEPRGPIDILALDDALQDL